MTLSADELRQRFISHRDAADNAWRTRLHRAISWLRRAEQEADDLDARFLFLWIAFNAAYASDALDCTEYQRYTRFARRIAELDGQERLHALLFTRFSGPVRVLLDNQYVFEPFWRAMSTADSSERWRAEFQTAKKRACEAVMRREAGVALSIVLDRLYVLRNQLVHGGATWQSSANRAQLRDGVAILGDVVTTVLAIMIEHPEEDFGAILYPSLHRPAKVTA